jgi:glucose-6-phosphate isomerase
MDERCRGRSWKENPALALAAVHVLMDRVKGKGICVLMPYSDALRSFADWFCQLWAESLGKRRTRTGDARAPVGQTPVRAVGATDQHSQLQLYVEGPRDKVVLFLTAKERGTEVTIPASELAASQPDYAYLAGKGLGELLDAELRGTMGSLRGRGRPIGLLELPRVTAPALGELLMLLEAATAFAGPLYGVDPYDQPGVEEAKRLAYAALGREGYR